MKNKDKVLIDEICQSGKNSVLPVMLNFENGSLSAFVKDDIYFGRCKNQTDNKQLIGRLIVNGQTYEGDLESNSSRKDNLIDNYICVRNKKTNKMRIIPIENVQLRNNVYKRLAKERKQLEFTEEVSKKTLLKKFGGRKAMRALRGREDLSMNVEVVQDDLQAKVDESVLKEDEINDTSLNMTENLVYFDTVRPPYNATATNVKDVFNFHTIIPKEILNLLEEDAKIILQMNSDEIPLNTPELVNKISSLQKLSVTPTTILHVQLLIYMDCLLAIIQSRSKTFDNINLNKIGKKISQYFCKEFADPKLSMGFSRTNFSFEKALCYYIVLSILINSKFEVNIETLSRELKTSKQKIIQYGRIVFAMPRQRKVVLALQLPSKIPTLPTSYTRKRRSMN